MVIKHSVKESLAKNNVTRLMKYIALQKLHMLSNNSENKYICTEIVHVLS